MRKFPWITLCLVLSGIALFQWGDLQQLVISNDAAARGESWRWLSGHFAHVDGNHLLWNLVALALLGATLERFNRWHLLGSLTAGIIGINLWLLSPVANLHAYAGLSGALNSLLVVVLFQLWQHTRSHLVLLTGVLSLLKILLEMFSGAAIFSATIWPPVPAAHLCGFFAGLFFVAITQSLSQKQERLCHAQRNPHSR